jgi:hypothetical protein
MYVSQSYGLKREGNEMLTELTDNRLRKLANALIDRRYDASVNQLDNAARLEAALAEISRRARIR